MAIVEGWLPPTREHWELIAWSWQFFPVLAFMQWFISFYPQGKTSITSRLNVPGRLAWLLMEIPGPLTLLYCMLTIPRTTGLTPRDLPWGNWTMAGMYVIHYLHRAVLAPLFLNPSMSPIHPVVMVFAFAWNVTNGLSLGGWLAGYGPRTAQDWSGRVYYAEVGLVVWAWGMLANWYHDDDLREIRRAAAWKQEREARERGEKAKGDVGKVYMIPKNGLFKWVLYAHFLCEWIEWLGFWMVGGWSCVPARSFLFNEISTMLPRAVQGKRWYIEKFGKEKVGGKYAVIPGVI